LDKFSTKASITDPAPEVHRSCAPGAETNNLGQADATFLHTDEDELELAAIVSARISEPDRMTGVLNELRVESTDHLGRLDLEEWSETGMALLASRCHNIPTHFPLNLHGI
jgi:hypothetical protein